MSQRDPDRNKRDLDATAYFSSSNSAFASFKSAVSKPSVNLSGAAKSLRVEYGPRLARQVLLAKRLLQQGRVGIEPAVMDDGTADVARHVERFHRRVSTLHFRGQVAPGHGAGQYNIGQQQIDIRVLVEPDEGTRAHIRVDHVVTEAGEQPDDKGAHILIVLDHQDGLAP